MLQYLLYNFGVTGEWTYAVDDKGTGEPEITDGYFIESGKFQYPIIQISPELIFSNQVEVLDADFIGGTDGKEYILESDSSALSTVRSIIASWYVTLRTIAVVGLLSVLIYIGIRIIISSTSQDRAKYKQRLVDWVVAFCLLFFMHYIMAGTVNVIDQINDILGTYTSERYTTINRIWRSRVYWRRLCGWKYINFWNFLFYNGHDR